MAAGRGSGRRPAATGAGGGWPGWLACGHLFAAAAGAPVGLLGGARALGARARTGAAEGVDTGVLGGLGQRALGARGWDALSCTQPRALERGLAANC